ncbi:MAG: circadian clock protein KaiB [Acidobacteria bacterium]|nr:circadian clock protein KaiB [Acidobacteriota bacterium]
MTTRGGKRRIAQAGRDTTPAPDTYVFQLFVAGDEPNSALALGNLVRICDAHIAGRYEIHTVDVLKNADAAYKHNVIVTPTVILTRPLPSVTLFGTLRDPAQVLAALRLTGAR